MVPDGVNMTRGTPGKDESELLVAGEVDAVFHAAEPRAYTEGHPRISRLFSDSSASEAAYFEKTGVFPIMHAVAVRKSLLKEHPWLAEAVFNAYSQAKQISFQQMANANWFMDMLPWYAQELERTRGIMGDNFYSYGMEANRKTLQTLFRYSYEQGFSSRELTIDDLFDVSGMKFAE